jgi:predicted TIM-barrel fold metal-dependent hydrolase
MRINGHAHIFDLHTVLTSHALGIMVNRVRNLSVPDFVADALERFLARQLEHPEYLVEDELLQRFLDHIGRTDGFRRFVDTTADLPVEIRLLGDGVEAFGVSALRSTLDRISSWFDDGASSSTTVVDVFETLRLAMKADVTGVAAAILDDMTPGDGLIALMMDITSEETAAADLPKFTAQLRATSETAVAFPGRVFPFVAVNSRRPDHFDWMRRAIEELGFVGVKLYPSLGCPVDDPVMMDVYDYCLANEVPILLHCTMTGFYESEATRELGAPDPWEAILEARPELTVCFAHTGGLAQGVLTAGGPSGDQWPARIEALMRRFPRVYCDLAYHVDQMVSPESEGFYLDWLRGLLDDPDLGPRVMFGTDIWMVRLSLSDAHYWRWFESHLTSGEMSLIAETAPAGFLGLPTEGREMRANIRRLVSFLEERPALGDEPAAWLAGASARNFVVQRRNPGWTPNNLAHRLTHGHMHTHMTRPQRKLSFDEAGSLRLRQLTYWSQGSVPDDVFRKDCRAVALSLASLARGSAGAFEGRHDATSVVDALAAALEDGEMRLAQLGGAVDALLRFPSEGL